MVSEFILNISLKIDNPFSASYTLLKPGRPVMQFKQKESPSRMSNPPSPQPGRPSPNSGRILSNRPASPGHAPAPVVYRYTQEFRQKWQTGAFLASWGPRLVALLIDLGVIGIPFNLLYNFILTFVPLDWLTINQISIGHDVLLWLVFGLITALTATLSGASLGKKLLNLQVVRQGNSRLPFGLFFLRETLVIYSLVSFYQVINYLLLSGLAFFKDYNFLYVPGFILGLGCLPLFLNPPHLPLHDRLFKTKVVIADPQKLG